MKQLPRTNCPLVIRIDFGDERAWKRICELIRAPVQAFGDTFYAHMEFLDDLEFRGLGKDELLERVPAGYNHSFLVVVDHVAVTHPDRAVLVVDLNHDRGRGFRALPGAIQSIENNLSIANMDFFEFARAVDDQGIFRGFRGRDVD